MTHNFDSLRQLSSYIRAFKDLEICSSAKNTVFGEGPSDADVMIMGEAPGKQEDIEARPFCGRSGKLLDSMLACVDLDRTRNVYISNSVFWRPPENRKPTEEEILTCRPFVFEHIRLKSPKILLILGATAMFSILDITIPISRVRGKPLVFDQSGLEIPTIVSFHPSYLLRQPEKKREAHQDLKLLRSLLDSLTIPA